MSAKPTPGKEHVPAEWQWPKVGHEERSWTPTIPDDLVSHAMRERHRGPYWAADVAAIADLTPKIRAEVLTLAGEAAAEIARFDAEIGGEVAPFASVLLRSESASSSMIENLTSGAKAIALAELGATGKRNATEMVGNVAAMNAALHLADRLDQDAILAMHTALMAGHASAAAGHFRQEQVWVGGTTFGPHQAAFIPPHHERVPTLVADLVKFTHRQDMPLLPQIAVAHAQFETIHPFVDGNRRTGRALVHAMLRGHGLTRNVTVPVSAGLLTDTATYFEALTAYRDGDPHPIVERLAHAAFAATTNGRQLVNALHVIRADWDTRIRGRRGSGPRRLVDILVRQPVVDAAIVSAELDVLPQNAHRAIDPLVDAGILTEFTGFARNRMWQANDVLAALDDFAARARRRG